MRTRGFMTMCCCLALLAREQNNESHGSHPVYGELGGQDGAPPSR